MSKYHFKEGEIVNHKDNIDLEMTISRILKESKEFIKGFDNIKNEPIKEMGVRMIGIECHWWEMSTLEPNKKELRIHKFHSSELIPNEIVKKGKKAIKDWLISQVNQRTYNE